MGKSIIISAWHDKSWGHDHVSSIDLGFDLTDEIRDVFDEDMNDDDIIAEIQEKYCETYECKDEKLYKFYNQTISKDDYRYTCEVEAKFEINGTGFEISFLVDTTENYNKDMDDELKRIADDIYNS